MKKVTIIVMVLVLAMSVSAFAKGKMAKSSGSTVTSGSVVSVDQSAKSFVLSSGGKNTTVYWTADTKVSGGELKANEKVSVRWMMKDGKAWAKSVRVGGRSAKKAA